MELVKLYIPPSIYIYIMKFDFYTCMSCGVIVDESNVKAHLSHDIVGEMYLIKSYKKKKQIGLISQSVVNAANEKIAEGRWERQVIKDKAKRIRDQERFEYQIPSGDVIINLLELK